MEKKKRRSSNARSTTIHVLLVAIVVVVKSSSSSFETSAVCVAVAAFSSLSSASTGLSHHVSLRGRHRRPSPQKLIKLWDSFDGQLLDDETSCLGEVDHDNIETEMIARVKFEVLSSINDVPAEEWDICCHDKNSSPFVQHAWLQCLEDSGCVSPETGWTPHHIQIKLGRDVCGFVPCYLKDHSMGEFIFDNVFADAAKRNGIEYYPKLLVGVPFTPVTGTRILLHSKLSESQRKSLRALVCIYLKKIATDEDLSSVHINFATNQEIDDIAGPIRTTQDPDNMSYSSSSSSSRQEKIDPTRTSSSPSTTATASFFDKVKSFLGTLTTANNDTKEKIRANEGNDKNDDGKVRGTPNTRVPTLGFLRRTSIQYHWHNRNHNTEDGHPYSSFDDYLSCFKSKRRISIKREREKILQDEGIRIDIVTGKDILKYDGLVDRMYLIYRSTVDKMLLGRQYLSRDFFTRLAQSSFVDNLCFLTARRSSSGDILKAQDVIAGTINCVKDNVFYGRYWGCLEDVKNLHFECCYWSALEYCIDNGLTRMEPGAGGGDYKWARGFDSSLVHSAHYFCHPGLHHGACAYLNYETEGVLDMYGFLSQNSVVVTHPDRPND